MIIIIYYNYDHYKYELQENDKIHGKIIENGMKLCTSISQMVNWAHAKTNFCYVLGRILFTFYMLPLGNKFRRDRIHFHC